MFKKPIINTATFVLLAFAAFSCEKQELAQPDIDPAGSAKEIKDAPTVSRASSIYPNLNFDYPVNTSQVPIDYSWNFASQHPILNGWYHSGIDYGYGDDYNGNGYSQFSGKEVKAAGAGRVMYVDWGDNNGYGRTVVVAHKYGSDNIYSLYGHLENINVSVNQYITKGYKIGTVGKTGSGSGGGYHLHFELVKLKDALNTYYGKGRFQTKSGSNAYRLDEKYYCNPHSYLGKVQYKDITSTTALPGVLKKSGVNLYINFNSPFTSSCNVDVRLALYRKSDDVLLGVIDQHNNIKFYYGNKALKFYKSSLTSPSGSNYRLRLEYSVPGKNEWTTMKASSGYNPKNLTITY